MNTQTHATHLVSTAYVAWCAATARKFTFEPDADTKQQFRDYLLDQYGVEYTVSEDLETSIAVHDNQKYMLMLLAYGS